MMEWLQLIISNILVASLIGSLAWLVGLSGERARVAHLLWVAFFVKLITPPIVVLPIEVPAEWFSVDSIAAANVSHHPVTTVPTAVVSLMIDGEANPLSSNHLTGLTSVLPSIDFWSCVATIWLSGFLYLIVRGSIRFGRFFRLLKNEGIVDADASKFVERLIQDQFVVPPSGGSLRRIRDPFRLKGRLRTWRRSPPVLRVPVRVSPMLFGVGRRTVIVCPDVLWKSFTEDERRSFLAHETAHFCRRDHWVRWLEWIVVATYWWFPGVYIARRQLERNEEACCDVWAVRQLAAPPRQYAESLLKVVDFISEHQAGIPQLASGMLPTDSLEERLRLVMKSGTEKCVSRKSRYVLSIACVSLLLLHPIPRLVASAQIVSVIDVLPLNSDQNVAIVLPADSNPVDSELLDMPSAPQGFWNRKPRLQWADFSLSLSGAFLTASAGRGVTIELSNDTSLRFSSDEFRAIAEIPATGRIVIGSHDGSVRVWDLTAGTAVSLLGRHADEVTSLAWHEDGGLVSGDGAGAVIRWDLQSGQSLATSTCDSSVQSVRYSADGTRLAILTGQWDTLPGSQTVRIVDGRSLETLESIVLTKPTAVVFAVPGPGWAGVDWTGNVRSIDRGVYLGRVAKSVVSAMVLAQRSDELNMSFQQE